MHLLLQDLRFAFRTLRKSPGLTTVIVLSLALGIGANTALFSVVNALLLKPLPYPNPDRLAILWLRSPGINIPQDWPSPGQYIDIRTENHVFEEMAILRGDSFNVTGLDQPQRVEGIRTSSTLLHMLGAKPLLGRLFLPEEDQPGKPPTVLLTYGLWKRLFGGDPQIVGKKITLNGTDPFTVVGVLRPDFLLNNEVIPTVASIERIEILLPLPFGADAVNRRGDENYNVLARLKSGATMERAQQEVAAIAGRIREKDHRDPTFTISVVPLLEQVVGNVRRAVLVLLGSVALVLLIACANVANLLLSRATGREKEVAIRAAMGAGRGKLVRQLLTETVLLGLAGGAGGLLIASWMLFIVRDINPGNIPRLELIGIDTNVLAFTFAVSLLTGMMFGLAPAFRVAKVDLNTSLKAGGRSSQSEGGFNTARHGIRSALVVAEVALSLLLLTGAGLLIRSFFHLASVPPGFNVDHVLSMRVAPAGPKYTEPARVQFYREVMEKISRVPGVKMQGAVSALPLTSAVGWGSMQIEGYTPPPNEPELQVDQRIATNDYFRAMEIPLVRGRFFSDHDNKEAPRAVLIDEKMARRFWPAGDAIGKRMKNGGPKDPWYNVVGVVGTVKQYGLDVDGRMVVYYPHAQAAARGLYLVARTSTDPASAASAIVSAIHAIDPDVVVYEVRTMQDRLHASLARQRFSMAMLAAFAGFALILAAVGVYGVMSYLVTQGTHDIGVRIALGAQRANIVGLVLRQGMTLAAIGITAGLIGAWSLTRVMASLLFGVSATDVATFSGVAIFLALVAAVACYMPARRAMQVDPMVALRYE